METSPDRTGRLSSHQVPRCCDACLEHEQIQQQISELESPLALAKLKEEEREITSRINMRHDPLQKMPLEIVSFIFKQTLDDDRSDYVTKLPFGPQDIGQVCRYWREVAWSTPSLWNKPTIVLNGFGYYEESQPLQVNEEVFDKQFEQLQNWISRSGSMPLFIFILYNEYRHNVVVSSYQIAGLIKYLQELDNSNLIVYLHLDMPFDYIIHFNGMRITSLKMTTYYAEWNNFDAHFQLTALTANLETLIVASTELVERLPGIPCPKLTNLEILNFPVQVVNLIQLMCRTPTLQRCYCEVKGEIPPMDTMQSPTVLERLHHLDITPRWRDNLSSLFDMFTLPTLRNLTIQEGDVDASSIISLFKRSQCHLKDLKVSGSMKWTIADLGSLLASLPAHPSLFFSHTFAPAPISEILRTVLVSSTTSRIERNIVTTFDCGAVWDSWDFIPELFGSSTHTHEKRPIDVRLNLNQSVEIFDDTPMPWISVEALRVIQELEDQGWRWSVDMRVPQGWIYNFIDASAKHHQEIAIE